MTRRDPGPEDVRPAGSRAVALIPIAVAAVLLGALIWMMATGRVWPSDGPGPGDQTIPSTPAPGAPTLPAQNRGHQAPPGLVFV